MNSKTIPKQKIEELNLDDEQNSSSRPRIDPNIILNEFPLSPQAPPLNQLYLRPVYQKKLQH